MFLLTHNDYTVATRLGSYERHCISAYRGVAPSPAPAGRHPRCYGAAACLDHRL